MLYPSTSNAWNAMSGAKKREVLFSYEEREIDEDLLDHRAVMDKSRDL